MPIKTDAKLVIYYFKKKFFHSFSKQPYLKETPDAQTAANFAQSRNNRYSTPEAAGKNRILSISVVDPMLFASTK